MGYESDSLTNNEIGFKTEWFDHRLIVNLSGYIMKWDNVQLPLFDPVHLGNTTFDINGPSYKVKGFEIQFVARLFEGFTLEGSSSVNSPEQTNAPCLPSNRPTAGNPTPLGQCISVVKENTYTNPYGVLGTRPPFSPPWMFNVRARYDWSMGALPALRLGRRQPHRSAEQSAAELPGWQRAAGLDQPDDHAAAVRDPRLHDLRRRDRRLQGHLDGLAQRQQLHQRVRARRTSRPGSSSSPRSRCVRAC